jgi:hypothetical protein
VVLMVAQGPHSCQQHPQPATGQRRCQVQLHRQW